MNDLINNWLDATILINNWLDAVIIKSIPIERFEAKENYVKINDLSFEIDLKNNKLIVYCNSGHVVLDLIDSELNDFIKKFYRIKFLSEENIIEYLKQQLKTFNYD